MRKRFFSSAMPVLSATVIGISRAARNPAGTDGFFAFASVFRVGRRGSNAASSLTHTSSSLKGGLPPCCQWLPSALPTLNE